jgi:hypothetical protein
MVLAQFRLRHVKQKAVATYTVTEPVDYMKLLGNHYNNKKQLHYILEQMQSMLMTNKHKM